LLLIFPPGFDKSAGQEITTINPAGGDDLTLITRFFPDWGFRIWDFSGNGKRKTETVSFSEGVKE